MNFIQKHFVNVKRGTKVTYSESDLRKLDRTYEKEVLDNRDRKVRSPMRKVPQQAYLTQLRDYAYEKVLDSHMYTFSHLLVVPNPYDIVKQSALLLFNSSKETKIRYRVLGDIPETDFVGETGYATRHRVPVLGLYLERSNKVELEMISEEGEVVKRRMLRIYVSESPKKIRNVLGENVRMASGNHSSFPFLLLNGVSFNPLVVDCEGKIRYSIQLRTNSIGMIPLENGHFLYEDRTANRMNKKGKIIPCRYHEMDYMGRVYKTFLFDFPLSGAVAQKGSSLFMSTSSDDSHVMDCIVEVDRDSGRILKRCDLAQIFGTKYRTREDWAHISKIACYHEKILVVLKRLHTIFEYDWAKEELIWVLSPEKVWEDNPVSQYLLQGDRPTETVCWKPDFASVYKNDREKTMENLTLFQVKANGDVRILPKDAADSSFVCLRIDLVQRTFQTISEHAWIKNKLHGSGFFSKDEKGILLCSGISKHVEKGKRGQITELDHKTGEELRTLFTRKGINTVWEFEPDIPAYGEAVPVSGNVIFGTLSAPEVFTGKMKEAVKKRIPREYFGGTRLCGELYISYFVPGTISNIYFIGKKHAYVQDYSGMARRRIKYPFAISLHDFEADEYTVYVEREGEVHRLKNEVRILV